MIKIGEYARFKRCLEMYGSDPEFRGILDSNPDGAIRKLGYMQELEGYPVKDAIHWILFRRGNPKVIRLNPYYIAYAELQQEIGRTVIGDHSREAITSPEMYDYLTRVRERCREENELIRSHDFIYYYPVSMELSDGCTCHCSFCGLQAGFFQGNFPYNPENAQIFRDVLYTLKEYVGDLLGSCPCYFATEPLDNPDYERFMMEIKEITGHFPQTTTALAEADPDRMRSYMKLVGEEEMKNRGAVRFSVRNLNQFKQIMDIYTPDELVYVELLANNPESVNRYSFSGRVRKDRRVEKQKQAEYSISCTAGLKINFCTGSMEFMEPVMPDERYPLGYRVLERGCFETGEEAAALIHKLYGNHICCGAEKLTGRESHESGN